LQFCFIAFEPGSSRDEFLTHGCTCSNLSLWNAAGQLWSR
jgi:hypothetical protein